MVSTKIRISGLKDKKQKIGQKTKVLKVLAAEKCMALNKEEMGKTAFGCIKLDEGKVFFKKNDGELVEIGKMLKQISDEIIYFIKQKEKGEEDQLALGLFEDYLNGFMELLEPSVGQIMKVTLQNYA